MASHQYSKKSSTRLLHTQAEQDVDNFISTTQTRADIRDKIRQYQAYAVEIASLTSQGDPDIRRWTNEVPSEYKENAKEKLAALSTNTDRDRARNLKELLQFYKDQVRKLERAYRRTDGDEPDNAEAEAKGSKGVLGRMISSLGLFASESKESKESCTSANCLIGHENTNKNTSNGEGKDLGSNPSLDSQTDKKHKSDTGQHSSRKKQAKDKRSSVQSDTNTRRQSKHSIPSKEDTRRTSDKQLIDKNNPQGTDVDKTLATETEDIPKESRNSDPDANQLLGVGSVPMIRLSTTINPRVPSVDSFSFLPGGTDLYCEKMRDIALHDSKSKDLNNKASLPGTASAPNVNMSEPNDWSKTDQLEPTNKEELVQDKKREIVDAAKDLQDALEATNRDGTSKQQKSKSLTANPSSSKEGADSRAAKARSRPDADIAYPAGSGTAKVQRSAVQDHKREPVNAASQSQRGHGDDKPSSVQKIHKTEPLVPTPGPIIEMKQDVHTTNSPSHSQRPPCKPCNFSSGIGASGTSRTRPVCHQQPYKPLCTIAEVPAVGEVSGVLDFQFPQKSMPDHCCNVGEQKFHAPPFDFLNNCPVTSTTTTDGNQTAWSYQLQPALCSMPCNNRGQEPPVPGALCMTSPCLSMENNPCCSPPLPSYINGNDVEHLEHEIQRLKKDCDAYNTSYSQLLGEKQRLSSRYDMEQEDRIRVIEKLERAEMKIDKLQKTLIKSKHMLSAAHSELTILRDPRITQVKDDLDIETQLTQALDERKAAIGQLKNVEKLLEEIIAEKDSLVTSNTRLKGENQKLKKGIMQLRLEVKKNEEAAKDSEKQLKPLHDEINRLKQETESYCKNQNKILHQKYEMEMSLTGMKKTKEQIEEMNIQLQAEAKKDKTRIEQLENEIGRYQQEVRNTQNSQVDEISHWKQKSMTNQNDTDCIREELVELQREHEKEIRMWKTNMAAVQENVDSFKEALKSAHQTIKSLRKQNDGIVESMHELTPPPPRAALEKRHDTAENRSQEEKTRDRELHEILRTAKECSALNDQTAACAGCRQRGMAIVKVCHEFCVYVEKERERIKVKKTVEPVMGEIHPAVVVPQDSPHTSSHQSGQAHDLGQGTTSPDHSHACGEIDHLKREIVRLQRCLQIEHYGTYVRGANVTQLQCEIARLSHDNDWLRCELTRVKKDEDKMKAEKQHEKELSDVIMRRASDSFRRGSDTLTKIKLPVIPAVIEPEMEDDDDEQEKAKEKPKEGPKETPKEPESKIIQMHLQLDEMTKAMVTKSSHDHVKEVLDDKVMMIEMLTEQNETLSAELELLKESMMKQQPAEKGEVEKNPELELAKKKIRKLSIEVESLNMKLKACDEYIAERASKTGTEPTTGFFVKMREEEIAILKHEIGELEKALLARTLSGKDCSKRRRDSKVKQDTDGSLSLTDKNHIFLSTSEENQKLKESVQKLGSEKSGLNETLRQKDATIYELSNHLEQCQKALQFLDDDIDEHGLHEFFTKIKQGEKQMGKLKVEMKLLMLKKPSDDDNKMSIDQRTRKAQRLQELINDCVSTGAFKLEEMIRLCDELDLLEAEHFDLTFKLKELKRMKDDLVPRIENELAEAKVVNEEALEELNAAQKNLKVAETKLNILTIEKGEADDKYARDLSRISREKAGGQSTFKELEQQSKTRLDEFSAEIRKVRSSLNETQALAQEKEGAALHWKLKFEDKIRENADLVEKYVLDLKGKDLEIATMQKRFEDLQGNLNLTPLPTESTVADVQSQVRDIQRQHIDLLTRTNSRDHIDDKQIENFYREIGDLSVVLHKAAKDRDREIVRLKQDVVTYHKEKGIFQEECAKMIQEKQLEIRKLSTEIEKLEVEAAKLNATKEQELADLRADIKIEGDKANTEKAHTNASKDGEISELKVSIEKLGVAQRRDGKTIQDLKSKIKKLELEKGELQSIADSCQGDIDKLKKELVACQTDKRYYERMVERLNKEMEARMNNVKRDSKFELNNKEEKMKEIYGRVEKIAHERGEISTELSALLKDKEAKIDELTNKVKAHGKFTDKVEGDYKAKLDRKNKEVKALRGEIKKMGSEGVRLLEQREKEITEMRNHLSNVLKVMESRYKGKDSNPTLAEKDEDEAVKMAPIKPAKTARSATTGDGAGAESKRSIAKAQKSAVTSRPTKRVPSKGTSAKGFGKQVS